MHLINKGNLISIMTKIFALTTIIDNILFHHYDSEKINQTINEDLLVYALNRYFVNKILPHWDWCNNNTPSHLPASD